MVFRGLDKHWSAKARRQLVGWCLTESRLAVPAVTQCFKDQPSEIPATVFDRHTDVLLRLKVRMFGLSGGFSVQPRSVTYSWTVQFFRYGGLYKYLKCANRRRRLVKVMKGEKERFQNPLY